LPTVKEKKETQTGNSPSIYLSRNLPIMQTQSIKSTLTIISVPSGIIPYREMSGAKFNAAAKFRINHSLGVRNFVTIL